MRDLLSERTKDISVFDASALSGAFKEGLVEAEAVAPAEAERALLPEFKLLLAVALMEMLDVTAELEFAERLLTVVLATPVFTETRFDEFALPFTLLVEVVVATPATDAELLLETVL